MQQQLFGNAAGKKLEMLQKIERDAAE